MKKFVMVVTVLFGTIMTEGFVRADLTIDFVQTGSDVTASTNGGSLNLSGLTAIFGNEPPTTPFVWPANSAFYFGSGRYDGYIGYGTINNYLGTASDTNGSYSTGGFIGASASPYDTGNYYGGQVLIEVPTGYVSGQTLSASSGTWSNVTLAGLGLTQGTYIYSWGSGSNADKITVDIGPVSTPEPSGYALMAFGILCLAAGYGYRLRMAIGAWLALLQ